MADIPLLERTVRDDVAYWSDSRLRERRVVIAFTERSGGVSGPPFASLNLAGHVGDDSAAVDENRTRALAALGLAGLRGRLACAEQVHGEALVAVTEKDAGSGAYAVSGTRPPIAATDALATLESDIPLLLCFADCVPVILVAPGPAIAVVHAGWRGALSSLPGTAARRLAELASCAPSDVGAYVGAHIGACHYEIGDRIMSHFVERFGTFARAESGGLDLGEVVSASLTDAGVDPCNIASLGICTAEATKRFFSYRAEGGLTGRHGALACILP